MSTYQSKADEIAKEYGIPPKLFRALIQAESGWNPKALSPAGAIGLTQLMPGTAKELGVDPYDPISNLRGGAKYLRKQLNAFGGNTKLALAAYNAGPGAVRKYKGIPPYKETQAYVKKVMNLYLGNASLVPDESKNKPVRRRDEETVSPKKLPQINLKITMVDVDEFTKYFQSNEEINLKMMIDN